MNIHKTYIVDYKMEHFKSVKNKLQANPDIFLTIAIRPVTIKLYLSILLGCKKNGYILSLLKDILQQRLQSLRLHFIFVF